MTEAPKSDAAEVHMTEAPKSDATEVDMTEAPKSEAAEVHMTEAPKSNAVEVHVTATQAPAIEDTLVVLDTPKPKHPLTRQNATDEMEPPTTPLPQRLDNKLETASLSRSESRGACEADGAPTPTSTSPGSMPPTPKTPVSIPDKSFKPLKPKSSEKYDKFYHKILFCIIHGT